MKVVMMTWTKKEKGEEWKCLTDVINYQLPVEAGEEQA